ncbi:unnamed protein product [Caenorhabditis bovis]|uniref:BHLH domain-containing protein n=1 Tax=Caenorhabditis bovis TaxID=2654633 RepID=A0A8S1F810_9PELO|nr:unnamed protein product [Caenorhabditis bovis]
MSSIPKIVNAPKKIGGAGPSKRRSPSTSLSLNAAERAELKKLTALLPSGPRSGDASKVVMQAATYIQQLAATVQARVKNGTLPAEMLQSLPPAFHSVRSTRIQKKRKSIEKKR